MRVVVVVWSAFLLCMVIHGKRKRERENGKTSYNFLFWVLLPD